jgi:hypothetical protein
MFKIFLINIPEQTEVIFYAKNFEIWLRFITMTLSYLREQTPKAQIMLLGQSLGPPHWSTGEHPRVGSPVKPA